jgi:flagellar biosynthesis GTPase FlhF
MSEPAVPPDTSNNVVVTETHENQTAVEDNAIELSAKQKRDLEKKQKEEEKKKQKEEKKKQKEEEKLRKKQEKQQRKAEKKAKKEGKTEVVPPAQTEEIKIDEEPDEEKDQEEPVRFVVFDIDNLGTNTRSRCRA